jgi:hypothetical protein
VKIPPPNRHTYSRRSVLQAGGLLSLAAVLGDSLRPAAAAAAAPAPSPSPTATPAPYVQPTPWYLQASCELSEDYFLTDEVVLGSAEDLVLPFTYVDPTSGDTQVEAIVLANGTVNHLWPDPTATSGWSYQAIATPFTTVSIASVGGGGFGGQLMVVGPSTNGYNAPAAVLTRVGGGVWSVDATFAVPEPIIALGVGVDDDAGVYWYAWVSETLSNSVVNTLFLYGADQGLGGVEMLTISYPTDMGITVENSIVLWDSNAVGTGPPTGFAVVLTSDGNITPYSQTSPTAFSGNADNVLPTSAASLLWAYATPGSQTGTPALMWQNQNGILGFQDENGNLDFTDFSFAGTAGVGQTAVWQLNDAYTLTLLDQGLASVVSEVSSDANGITWTSPIPLTGGFEAIFSVATDPTQSTLFAIDAALTLNVLTKDPTTGWTQIPVHQASEQFAEVTSWRVLMRLLDANDTPVSLAQVQLTASEVVGCWQTTGSTILGSTPVTMTTDAGGRITFSVPTVELDTATLTATPLNSSGGAAGSPFTITPNVDVNSFLAGGSSLPDVGKLSGTALLSAQNSDNSPVFSTLTSLPSSGQAQAASNCAAAINHITALAQGATPADINGTQSAQFDLSGSSPTWQTSNDPSTYKPSGSGDWWDRVKADAESAWHGLRHGVIAFKTMVTQWASDVGQWTINLVVDIGDGIDHLMTWIVKGMEDAIHAISSFFKALGADLKDAWDWLKHNILALLRNAETNAAVIEGWIDQIGTEFGTVIDDTEQFVAGYFQSLEGKITTKLGDLATDFEDLAFGTSVPMPQPSNNTGSNTTDAILKDAAEAVKIMHYVDGQWLWDKLLDHLPTAPQTGPTTSVNVNPLLTQLATDLTDAVAVIEDLGTLAGTAFQDLFSSKSDYTAATIADFFGQLDQLVVDVCKLADALVNTLLDLMALAVQAVADLMAYPLDGTDGPIADLFRLAGIKVDLSVGHIISLIASFPATLAWGIVSGNQIFPTTTAALAAAPGDVGAGDVNLWGAITNWLSFPVETVWAIVDTYEDAALITPDQGPKLVVPGWCNYVDIAAPLLLAVLQWPSPKVNGQTQPPFTTPDFGGPDGEMIPFFQLLGILPALCNFAQTCIASGPSEDYDPNGSLAKNFQPYVQCIAAVGDITLSSLYNVANNANTNTKALSVLSELSYLLAPLGTSYVDESSDGISVGIKVVADIGANTGTVAAYVVAAIDAS